MAAYTSQNTDEELYQLIQKGVEKAFDTFFLRHYPALCSYANQFVEREDAEEIAQEIMIWFWENRTMPVWGNFPDKLLIQSRKKQMYNFNK